MNARQREAIILAGGVMLGVSVIFNAVLLGRTATINRRLQEANTSIVYQSAQLTSLNSKVDELVQQVQESGSLLSHSNVEVGVSEQGHILVDIQVTPKSLRADDIVIISIGDIYAQAVKDNGSYQAQLELPVYSGNLSPVVTIESSDGSKQYETLSGISTDNYLQLYYSFDISYSRGEYTVNMGFQPKGDCILTFPEHLKNIWLEESNNDDDMEKVYMSFSGNRIPEASGNSSAEPSEDTGDLYYTYYSATLTPKKGDGMIHLTCKMITDGGLIYTVDIGEIEAGKNINLSGGGGSIGPSEDN